MLSTGDVFTEILLDRSPTTLIVGDNGAGKSTILDAICFGLFGKPFRKINKPQLINSVNNKGLVVEIEFSIGKTRYKIHRGIKPAKFEIYVNDKLIDQTASVKDYQDFFEKNILKLNFTSFTQIVILGSTTFVPFMQLPAYQRRAIIEDLLDIKIFTAMNILLKEKVQNNKQALGEIKYQIDLEQEKLNVHEQYIEDIENQNQKRIDNIKNEISKAESSISRLSSQIDLINKNIEELYSKIGDKTKIENGIEKLKSYEKRFTSRINKIAKELEFYQENDVCPTCTQEIDSNHKHSITTSLKDKQERLESDMSRLEKELSVRILRMSEIDEVQKLISQHQYEISDKNSQISGLNKYVTKLNRDLSQEDTEVHDLAEETKKVKESKKQISKLEKARSNLTYERELLDVAATMLKDTGIKTQIVRQYIPIMNKLINKYLSDMDFFVSFEINENFEESIKSRHRDDFTYGSFSEGEKMRIDLALLLTWRAIAKMKNSANTNLLILDEVFDASLDVGGCEEFLKLLDELSKDSNIFVISHKGDILQDKFRSVIRFEKVKNFSQIAR